MTLRDRPTVRNCTNDRPPIRLKPNLPRRGAPHRSIDPASWSVRCGGESPRELQPTGADALSRRNPLADLPGLRAHHAPPNRPEISQQHGYVHAGATSAIADSAGGYAALTLFDEHSEVLTVEYKLNLLAPAAAPLLEAVGTVAKSGRTLTICTLEVFGINDGERTLVATGLQTLLRVDTATTH